MEDNVAEKLSNLKSLNTMLVNETAKKRQEITALLDDKKSLETELTRSESEVESLRSVLSRVTEEMGIVGVENDELRRGKEEVQTELTRSESKVESMRSELTRVREELNGAKMENERWRRDKEEVERKKCVVDLEIEWKELGNQLRGEIETGIGNLEAVLRDKSELERAFKEKDEEVKELRGRLSESEAKKRNVVKELEGSRGEYEVVGKALRVGESRVTGMRFQCDGLKKEVESLSGENEGLRKIKSELEGQLSNMGKEACRLNAVVLSLREDVDKCRVRFSELEKSNVEVVMELDRLKTEFGALLKEKKAKEREIEKLKRINEEVTEEKNMLDAVKSSQEDKIRELQSEVNEICENLLLIQELNKDQLENNVKLLSEINDHKIESVRVVKERDDVKRTLDEEKMNGVKLHLKVSEISKKMEETAKVVEDLEGASDTVVTEKKELENKYNKLADEKGLIEKNYFEANEKISELESSLRSKSEMFQSSLVMLRNTSMQFAVENQMDEDEGMTVNERGINGGMTHYMTQLELIRSVLRTKDEKVGELEQQMEKLQLCVLDAKKKKSFWTLVSSATTIFAAVVSFAYAKGLR